MKIANFLTVTASVIFIGLSLVALGIDLSIHGLQAAGQSQQQELQALDAKVEEQKQAQEALDVKKDEQSENLRTQRGELQKQQQALQAQQVEIDKGGKLTREVGPNLLRDMALSATKNEKMKALLTKHGYNVQPK